MYAKLIRLSDQQVLIPHLEIADSLPLRLKGLLGLKSMASNQGLWIQKCNSIHTFFMKFSIDCIFLDSEMRVIKLMTNLKPQSLVLPVPKARTTVEVSAGIVADLDIRTGDILHVGR